MNITREHRNGSTTVLSLLLITGLALAGAGCLPDDGDDGGRGPAGTTGDDGPAGDDGPPGFSEENVSSRIELTGAGIDGDNPWIEFRALLSTPTQPWGVELAEFADYHDINFSFTVAHLTSAHYADGTAIEGNTESWRSLIFSSETEESDPAADPPEPFTGGAVQAGREDRSWEAIQDMGGGLYRYTFDATTNPECDDATLGGCEGYNAPAYAETDPHRFTVALRGNELWSLNEAVADFNPAVNDKLNLQRKITSDQTCASCHEPFAKHGGRHQDTTGCMSCHNDFNWDMGSGENLAMKSMIHKIHQGEDLLSVQDGEPFRLFGFFTSDFSDVAYPGEIQSCARCHTDEQDGPHDPHVTATSQGSNWEDEQYTNKLVCASCHDTEAGYTSGGWHDEGHWVPGHQNESTNCAGCHEANNDRSALLAHGNEVWERARGIEYRIMDVTVNGDDVEVTYQVLDANGDPVTGWDIADNLDLRIGWGAVSDYTHNQGAEWPGETMGTLGNPTGDNTTGFTVTGTLPAEAEGVLSISLEGDLQDDQGLDVAATSAVSFYDLDNPAADTARRHIVDSESCVSCHERIEYHGSNRTIGPEQESVQVCQVCHNPHRTDIAGREEGDWSELDTYPEFTDGKDEAPVDFHVLIHSMHADREKRETPYAIYRHTPWGGSSEYLYDFGYPNTASDCTACHDGDSYELPLTVNAGRTSHDTEGASADSHNILEDHYRMTRTVAVCSACHDDEPALAHMENMYGATEDTAYTEDELPFETCSTCHGAEQSFNMKKVHGLR